MFVGYYYVLRGHLLTQQRDSTATAAAAAGKVTTLLVSDSPQLEVLRRCVNKKSAAASVILKTFSLGVQDAEQEGAVRTRSRDPFRAEAGPRRRLML